MRKSNVTIGRGENRSAVVSLIEQGVQTEKSLTFYVPAEVAETVTVYVGPDLVENSADRSYLPMQTGGANVTLPAGKATVIHDIISAAFVLVAGGKVAADRVIGVIIA